MTTTDEPKNETTPEESAEPKQDAKPEGVRKKPAKRTVTKKDTATKAKKDKAATKGKTKTRAKAEAKADASAKTKSRKKAKAEDAPKAKARPTAPKLKVTTLDELCAEFLQHLVAIGKSVGTARSYNADLAVARKHFGGDTKVKALTARKVAAFFASDAVNKLRDGREKNPITSAKIKRVFRQCLIFATEGGVFAEAPLPDEQK